MTSFKDLKNFFEDAKKSFGLDVEVEEANKELKVTFDNVEFYRYEIGYLLNKISTEYFVKVNAGGSKAWVHIGGRGSVFLDKHLTEEEAIRKDIYVDSGVRIKGASLDKNKFSVIYVEDNEGEEKDE